MSASFNPFVGYPNQNKIGDYITIVSDNTGANVAYCATFNLEEDIYYVRVSPPTPPPAKRAVVGDFNSDGKPDYVLHNANTRQTSVWYLNNNVYIGSALRPNSSSRLGVEGCGRFRSRQSFRLWLIRSDYASDSNLVFVWTDVYCGRIMDRLFPVAGS